MLSRCVLGAIAVVVLGCGKKDEASSSRPSASSSSPSPSTPADAASPPMVDAAAPPPPPPPEPASHIAVKPAFGGTVPTLPQLSRDGSTAAVDVSRSLSTSRMTSFEVGFVSGSGRVERVAVLDLDSASRLADDPAAKVDTAALERAASSIKKRLADGGFSELSTTFNRGVIAKLGEEARTRGEDLPLTMGEAKLVVSVVVNPSGPASLKLRLDDAAGKKVAEQVVPGIAGGPSSPECRAAPRLAGAWFDAPRKRMLLEIEYMTAGCAEIPDVFQLWKLP